MSKETYQEKEIRKLYKKLKINTLTMTQDEINKIVLDYVEGDGYFMPVHITAEQQKDKNFMLEMAKLGNIYFLPAEELFVDPKFMLDYTDIRLKKAYKDGKSTELGLIDFIGGREFRDVEKVPEFWMGLAERHPDVNIAKLVNGRRLFGIPKYRKPDIYLPTAFMCQQVRKFGVEALKFIPKEYPNFSIIVAAAAEVDGVKALDFMPCADILQNKAAIVMAANKDGAIAFDRFLHDSLSPVREVGYMCHGDYHSYTGFFSEYVEVQKALLNDNWIWDSLQFDEKTIDILKKRLAVDVKFGEARIERDRMLKEKPVLTETKGKNKE